MSFFNRLNEAKLGDSSIDTMKRDLITERCFTIRSFYLKFLDWDQGFKKRLAGTFAVTVALTRERSNTLIAERIAFIAP